jgi:L-asparaginase II
MMNGDTDILAETTRGGLVESRHAGIIAVIDHDGHLAAGVGDVDQVIFFRSSAKPFQAVPVIESGAADAFGLTPAELALCCASHNAEPRHQEQVAVMLQKIGLTPDALRCGAPLPSDRDEAARVVAGLVPRTPLQCDCSGKRAGILATCVHLQEPLATYLNSDHPAQRRILAVMGTVLRTSSDTIPLGVDGCGLPTFAAPVRAFAGAFAALARPELVSPEGGGKHAAALNRLRGAMAAHPENVAGTGELVTDLMRLSGGRVVAKSGAEGLICLALPELGLGVAVRVLDGSFRAHAVIVASLLEQLDALDEETIASIRDHHPAILHNHVGRVVGDVRAAFALRPRMTGAARG